MGSLSFDSPIGRLTVRESGGAIVSIRWDDADSDSGGSPVLEDAHRQLDDYFAGKRRHFDLPLHIDGTALQLAVWNRMMLIPYGRTETYGDVAARIGSAARAVGTACGRNPIPIVVPCHRIVGGGGALTGYSGGAGVDTKKFLLDLESGEKQLDLH